MKNVQVNKKKKKKTYNFLGGLHKDWDEVHVRILGNHPLSKSEVIVEV